MLQPIKVKMKTGCWIKFEFFALIRKCTYKLALKGEENCGNEICFGPKTTPKMNNLEWFDINHILESNVEQERPNFEVMTSFFPSKVIFDITSWCWNYDQSVIKIYDEYFWSCSWKIWPKKLFSGHNKGKKFKLCKYRCYNLKQVFGFIIWLVIPCLVCQIEEGLTVST